MPIAAAQVQGGLAAMNFAHMIYEVWTNRQWGMKNSPSTLNLASFVAAANTLYNEGLGASGEWTREDSIDNFLQVLLDHAAGVFYPDPSTGLMTLKLLRADYDVGSLAHYYDQNAVIEVESYQQGSYAETINQITVTFKPDSEGRGGSVTRSNSANIQIQGGVINQTVDYPLIASEWVATILALRDLKALSRPLAKARLRLNRTAASLHPGAVFKWSYQSRGVTEMVMRVNEISRGSPEDGSIVVDCVEDVFSTRTNVPIPSGGEWEDTATAAYVPDAQSVEEAPYWALLQRDSASSIASLDAGTGFIWPLAVSPSAVSLGYNLWERISPDDFALSSSDVAFTATALLTAALPRANSSDITFGSQSETDSVAVGWYGRIGSGPLSEIIKVTAVDLTLGTATINRGMLDTTPQEFLAGERIWFFPSTAFQISEQEWMDGDVVDATMLTFTSSDQLEVGSGATSSVTMASRLLRPYPPADIQFVTEEADEETTSLSFPAEILDDNITVTWVHRNRLNSTPRTQTGASLTAEAGTTYNVYLYLDADDTLLDSEVGLSSTTTTATLTTLTEGFVRLEIESVRDGYSCHQRQVRAFFFLPSSNLRTDQNQSLLTEQPAISNADRKIQIE